MPWWLIPDKDAVDQNKRVFSWRVLICVTISAFCSFLTGLSLTLGYQKALESNINQGIGSSVTFSYIIPASVMCWICFGEKVSPIQSVGILIGVTGVILLGSSKPS